MAKKKTPPGFNTKNLTTLLKQIGQEIHDCSMDGEPVTKDEALIRTVWNKALGYKEVVRNDKGVEKEISHKPEKWALELIYNRREGAVPVAQQEDSDRITAAKQVSDLAKDRLNKKVKS